MFLRLGEHRNLGKRFGLLENVIHGQAGLVNIDRAGFRKTKNLTGFAQWAFCVRFRANKDESVGL